MRAFFAISGRVGLKFDSLNRDDLLFELEKAYEEIDTLTNHLERECCVGRTVDAYAAAIETIFSNP